jgi:hypothetical protein
MSTNGVVANKFQADKFIWSGLQAILLNTDTEKKNSWRPAIIEWARHLQDKEILDIMVPLQNISTEYGAMQSNLSNIVVDTLNIPLKLIKNELLASDLCNEISKFDTAIKKLADFAGEVHMTKNLQKGTIIADSQMRSNLYHRIADIVTAWLLTPELNFDKLDSEVVSVLESVKQNMINEITDLSREQLIKKLNIYNKYVRENLVSGAEDK